MGLGAADSLHWGIQSFAHRQPGYQKQRTISLANSSAQDAIGRALCSAALSVTCRYKYWKASFIVTVSAAALDFFLGFLWRSKFGLLQCTNVSSGAAANVEQSG